MTTSRALVRDNSLNALPIVGVGDNDLGTAMLTASIFGRIQSYDISRIAVLVSAGACNPILIVICARRRTG